MASLKYIPALLIGCALMTASAKSDDAGSKKGEVKVSISEKETTDTVDLKPGQIVYLKEITQVKDSNGNVIEEKVVFKRVIVSLQVVNHKLAQGQPAQPAERKPIVQSAQK